MKPPLDFLGLPLHPLVADELIDWLLPPQPEAPQPAVAGYLNAHTVNLALRSGGGESGDLLKQFDLVYPDGMSVVREARRRGNHVPERVSGADFFLRFCWAAASRKKRIAFIGGDKSLAERLAEHLSSTIPGLQIAHTADGFFAPESAEEQALLAALREKRPDVVLLGMGSPRQERFALRLRQEALPRTWCVGALFEYFTPGVRRHAPLWMRSAGLEWAFRLAQEPRRLAGRYLVGNFEFLWRTRSGR